MLYCDRRRVFKGAFFSKGFSVDWCFHRDKVTGKGKENTLCGHELFLDEWGLHNVGHQPDVEVDEKAGVKEQTLAPVRCSGQPRDLFPDHFQIVFGSQTGSDPEGFKGVAQDGRESQRPLPHHD